MLWPLFQDQKVSPGLFYLPQEAQIISSLQGTADTLDSPLEKQGALVASTLIKEVGGSSLLSLRHPCRLCKCLDGQPLNKLHCF